MATGADETANYDRTGAPMTKKTAQINIHAGTWKIKDMHAYLAGIGVECNRMTIWRALDNDARRLEEFPGAYQDESHFRTWRIPIAEAKAWRPQPSGKDFVAKRVWG